MSAKHKKRGAQAAAYPDTTALPSATAPLSPQTPSLVRRLVGMLYETLLMAGLLAVFFLMPHVVIGVVLRWSAPPAVLLLHCALVLMVYFCWFWLHGGQTLAMRTWKMRLESANGLPVRPVQAMLRYLAAWFSIISGVGVLWALVDRDKQFLHDRVAGTRLVIAG